ncbi:MAG: hypothetical protein M1832_003350 [Thelocarpon impressellum]|nr:MAG: hypothetical protein M1832_003350 [Thelocarpon impressellum]
MAVGGLKVIPKAVRSDAAIADPIAEPMVFRSRSYQLEMLDMDTGSGKTHMYPLVFSNLADHGRA